MQAYADNCVGDLYYFILGDENSVNYEVEYDLNHDFGILLQRFDGVDRYDTNLMVFEYGETHYNWDHNFAFIAKGTNFPDALSIAPFLAEHGSPLLLVDPKATSLTPRQLAVVASADTVYALGDENSVSSGVFNQAGCYDRLDGNTRYETSAETAADGNFPMRETLATAGRVSMLRVFGGPDAQTVPVTVYAQAAAAVGWGDNYKPVER